MACLSATQLLVDIFRAQLKSRRQSIDNCHKSGAVCLSRGTKRQPFDLFAPPDNRAKPALNKKGHPNQ